MEPSGTRQQPPQSPLATWSALGSGSPLQLVSVEVTMVELEFRRPIGTAIGSHRRRPLVMVRLVADGPGGPVVGWGECAALADTTFDDEDAESAFAALTHELVPKLGSHSQAVSHSNTGLRSPAEADLPASIDSPAAPTIPVPGPAALAGHLRPVGAPLAFAALEMAVADLHLRSSGISFAELLGEPGASVLVGAVVGTSGSVTELLAQVDALVDAGFARVKLKIGPGWDTVPATAVRRRYPDLILQVDANGSYTSDDIDHLVELDQVGLACIEQPFPRDELGAHVALAHAMGTDVCLDESLDSPASVRRAIGMGACDVVCVKPARLGGLTAALEVYGDCTDVGVPLWLGGMFESGYARSVNTALAALPGFTLPGDLAPAGEYLTEDLVGPPGTGRTEGDGRLRVAAPTAPGMGPPPDEEILARRATASWRWSGP
ncbi:MAG: o-succinylbenzoate synthase [Acidimicrobiales bacterium]